MSDVPNKPRRKHLRLRGFDYGQPGAYFVTICTQKRRCILGDVVDDEVVLSPQGRIVSDCWHDLANHYEHIELDEFVVMPNHIHGIVVIIDSGKGCGANEVGAGFKPAPKGRHSLSEVVRAFKTFSARRINHLRNRTGEPVWQRNYYEHGIRDDTSLLAVREYIVINPAKWSEDRDNPLNLSSTSL